MEQFTQGHITENKGELIKSLIQLKGFQRAFGDRWNGRLEAQTSQEGPKDPSPIHSLPSHCSIGKSLTPLEQNSKRVTGHTAASTRSTCSWCPTEAWKCTYYGLSDIPPAKPKSNKQNPPSKTKTLQRMRGNTFVELSGIRFPI